MLYCIRVRNVGFVIVIAQVLCPMVAAGQESLEPAVAAQALSKFYKDRMNPKPWRCEVQIRGKQFYNNQSTEYAEAWEVWRQGQKLKAVPVLEEFQGTRFIWKSRTGSIATLCKGCYSPETLVHFGLKYQDRSADTKSGISVYDESMGESHFAMPDPRYIGLLPMDLMNTPRFFSFKPYDWEEEEIKIERREGTADQWILKTGRVTFIGYEFIVRWKGGAIEPLAIHRTYVDQGREHSEKLDVEYKRDGDALLPVRTIYSNSVDGRLLAEETCVTTTLAYGQTIDDDVFTLKEMGLPAGRSVNWGSTVAPPGAAGKLIFNGISIVEDISQNLGLKLPAPVNSRLRMRFIYFNIAVLAGLLFYLTYRRLHSR